MTFVLSRGKTFTTDVAIKEPGDDNKILRSTLRVTFERRSASEFDDVLAEERRLKAEGESANGRAMWLYKILKHVSGMKDQDKNDIEFTPESKAELIDDQCARDQLFGHYWECVNNGKVKLGN